MRKQRERKKLIVNRSKWRSGDGMTQKRSSGKGEIRLLNNEGYMCCLGFACKQFGDLEDKHILHLDSPKQAYTAIEKLSNHVFHDCVQNTSLSKQAMTINDDSLLTREEREKELKALFSKFHVDLSFVGKYE